MHDYIAEDTGVFGDPRIAGVGERGGNPVERIKRHLDLLNTKSRQFNLLELEV